MCNQEISKKIEQMRKLADSKFLKFSKERDGVISAYCNGKDEGKVLIAKEAVLIIDELLSLANRAVTIGEKYADNMGFKGGLKQ